MQYGELLLINIWHFLFRSSYVFNLNAKQDTEYGFEIQSQLLYDWPAIIKVIDTVWLT